MSSPLSSTSRWLSIRVRIACIAILAVAGILPPYVPSSALSPPEDVEISSQQFLLVEEGFLMKSSTLSKQGARRAYTKGIVHAVKSGESLEKIASTYGINVNTIRWANALQEGTPIQPGQELVILPVDGVLHTVARGQNLTDIADLYGIEPSLVAEQNAVKGGFLIAGQQLIIPGGSPVIARPVIAQKPPVTKPAQPSVPTPGQPSPPAKAAPADDLTPGVLQKPCSAVCFITQYYHGGHYALDMQERGGGPVYASEGGTVIRAETGWNGGYGNVVEIDHGNELVTLYGHNKELLVKEGDVVTRGQQIAWMGNTGLVYGKTGIHVHFEVQLKGVKKNPLLYLE